jgi:hypothetical protein
VRSYLTQYNSAQARDERTQIIHEIVDKVSTEGRFLRYDSATTQWSEADRKFALSKTGQALRYYSRDAARQDESAAPSLEGRPPPQRQSQLNEPILSNKAILAAIGYHLDEETNEITPMIEPLPFVPITGMEADLELDFDDSSFSF